MCDFASFVVLKDSARVLWKRGIDSHSEILKQFGIKDDYGWLERNACFVEITPPFDDRKAPIKDWKFVFDLPLQEPYWWTAEHTSNCYSALQERLKSEKGSFVVKEKRRDGTVREVRYYKDGLLHRTNGPAIIGNWVAGMV